MWSIHWEESQDTSTKMCLRRPLPSNESVLVPQKALLPGSFVRMCSLLEAPAKSPVAPDPPGNCHCLCSFSAIPQIPCNHPLLGLSCHFVNRCEAHHWTLAAMPTARRALLYRRTRVGVDKQVAAASRRSPFTSARPFHWSQTSASPRIQEEIRVPERGGDSSKR